MGETGQKDATVPESLVTTTALVVWFVSLSLLNLFVLIQANQLGFSQTQQPYDFYVLLHSSTQVFSSPSQLYVHQDPSSFGLYWAKWLWDGASYLYTPMFAVILAPLAFLTPTTAKIVWELLSFILLVTSTITVAKVIPSVKLKFLLPLLILIMPFQVIYTDQTLPQFWLPQVPGMWVSPVFFADYYWGNTNTAILALGLLSYYFAARTSPVDLHVGTVPTNILSSLFLALDSFKITALFLIFPFWLALNRKKALNSLGFLVLFLLVFNAIVFIEPSLIFGYLTAITTEPTAALWQVYEYVWYYTLPLVGIALLVSEKHVHHGSSPGREKAFENPDRKAISYFRAKVQTHDSRKSDWKNQKCLLSNTESN